MTTAFAIGAVAYWCPPFVIVVGIIMPICATIATGIIVTEGL